MVFARPWHCLHTVCARYTTRAFPPSPPHSFCGMCKGRHMVSLKEARADCAGGDSVGIEHRWRLEKAFVPQTRNQSPWCSGLGQLGAAHPWATHSSAQHAEEGRMQVWSLVTHMRRIFPTFILPSSHQHWEISVPILQIRRVRPKGEAAGPRQSMEQGWELLSLWVCHFTDDGYCTSGSG